MLLPTLALPAFDLARANMETCLRLTLTMNDTFRQFSELNRKTIDTALADERIQYDIGEASQPAWLARWPSYALNYAAEAMETWHAATSDVMETLSAPASQNARLVHDVSDMTTPAAVPRPSVILDAEGDVVKRLTS
jgi:hypothetical protein